MHIQGGAETLSVKASEGPQGCHDGPRGGPVVAHTHFLVGGGWDPCDQAAQQAADFGFEATTLCTLGQGATGPVEALPEGAQARG